MKAIILAAGRGSRMQGLTEEVPKCFLKYKGKRLIEWQIEAITKASINEVAIITGYKKDLFNEFPFKKFYNPRWSETNMVSTLEEAHDWLENDQCIVSYSDIFYDSAAIESLKSSDAHISVTFDPFWLEKWQKRFTDPLTDAETFNFNSDFYLTDIGEKARHVSEIKGQYMGLLKFDPIGWREMRELRESLDPKIADKMHMTGSLNAIIQRDNIKIKALKYMGDWGEFDSPSDLQF